MDERTVSAPGAQAQHRPMLRRAACAAIFLMLVSAASVSASSQTVTVTNRAYKPATVTMNVCDTVSWHNKATKKHVVVSNVQFLPPNVVLNAGATSSPLAFTQAGTFLYHDQSKASMKGTIRVSPSVTPDNG